MLASLWTWIKSLFGIAKTDVTTEVNAVKTEVTDVTKK